MVAYTVRRLLLLIPVLLGMLIIVFSLIHAIPGDPARAILGQLATKEAVAELSKQLGLDQPMYIQFFDYIKDLVTGNLGTSLKTQAPISDEIWPYFGATVELALVAMFIAIVVGVNAGIISAWFKIHGLITLLC